MSAQIRPLYWSIRREVWENRSVYLAPLIVAAVVLFGTFMATLAAGARGADAKRDVAKAQRAIVAPIGMAPAPIMFTTFLVGVFYAIDALYGERRDRSILFWKSLPVSDWTAVLAKAIVPLAVLPLLALALGMTLQLILLPITTAVSFGSGTTPETLWSLLPEPFLQIYGMTAHTLWFAPIYCWFLLVSAWAKRAPLLWAMLPGIALCVFERVVFGTHYFMNMLYYRFGGAMKEAWANDPRTSKPIISLSTITPLNFLSAPGLWLGLFFAAACLAAAVRLRRNREPI